jgi:lantibiotic biosynthesis protein
MTTAPVEAHPDSSSLFMGAPAVAFILHATGQAAFAKALATLDGPIDLATRERLRRAHERMDNGQLPALREFDLISGLTGLGVYQLRRYGDNELLREVLSYLVRLCEPVLVDGQFLPGWWTSNDTADHPPSHWPDGHGNLGLAHGISGPLALMSSAARRDLRVPGQIDAINRICTWLDQWKQGDGLNAWWPGTVTMNELTANTLHQPGPQRPSWCYGTPGIARTQQLAGLALADQSRRHLAETALLGCIISDAQLEQLSDASLCHGWAGLVQASWRMAADAGIDSPLASQLPALTSRFDDFLRAQGAVQGEGLLEGAAGVRLVQLTTASTVEPSSGWDVCLLLDG